MNVPETLNADYMASQYKRWKSDPDSVSKDWRYFFMGFEMATVEGTPSAAGTDGRSHVHQASVERLIYE
jgi:2-oxoglutarate dehydrogenase E1 component